MSILSDSETSPSEVGKKTYFCGSIYEQLGSGWRFQLIFCVLRKASVFSETMFMSWGRTPKMDVKSVRGIFLERLIIFILGILALIDEFL